MLPSWRAIVANAPVTPSPPLTVSPPSRVNAGHESMQPALQLLVVAVSGVKRYRVLPSSPVRNMPSPATVASSTLYASAAWEASGGASVVAGGCVAAVVVGAAVPPVPALLHAATSS